MYKTVFYVGHINVIGGVETFLYEIAKKYGDRDITVMYQNASAEQLKRLRKLVRVVEWTYGTEFECETLITNFDVSINDYCKAEKYIYVIHADFGECNWTAQLHPKINQYIAVSKAAKNGWKKATGLESEVCYNPISIDNPKKVLRLISCTRLSEDKGGKRMEVLANKLTEAGVPFLWTVFTNSKPIFENPNVVFLPSRLDGVRDMIANSDYLVQLSDNEACCYAILEALSLGVPAITTPFPSSYELGVSNGKTGYILPFDMSDIPCDDIYRHIPKFIWEAPKDRWDEIITKEKSTYKGEMDMQYKVKATEEWERQNLTASDLDRVPKSGEEWVVSAERLAVLSGDNPYQAKFVEVVEEIKSDRKAPATKGRKKK